jgi:phosphonatase-like hydrolase
MSVPALVVFDIAGTTVEDRGSVNRCFREALASAGLEADPRAIDAVMGLAKPEAIRILIEQSGRSEEFEAKIDAIHADFVARMIAFYQHDRAVRSVSGIERVFERLRDRGALIALDTGFSREITDVILGRLGWNGPTPIAATVTSDEVPRGRPHPDMIRHLMARTGVSDPSDVAKVGDAPADLHEGTNAGCGWVVGVTWGTHTREQLEGLPHTHLVDDVDGLAKILLGEESG